VTAATGTDERYATAMGELWTGLARTLSRLDLAAADPSALDEPSSAHALRRLQYALHLAGERAYGIEPPPGGGAAHAELADALEQARDLTAEVAAAAATFGADGISTLVHEWRGALFRVRLARHQLGLTESPGLETVDDGREPIARPLVAFLLALCGAVAFVGGATIGLWPLWAAGMLAVSGSFLAYRP
jgi:hypothetical protein